MSEPDKLHDAIARGTRAKELLNDPLLAETFDAMESDYIKAWRATGIHQADDRERLFIAINQLAKFRERLSVVISNGAVANAELNHLIETAERKKRFGIL